MANYYMYDYVSTSSNKVFCNLGNLLDQVWLIWSEFGEETYYC